MARRSAVSRARLPWLAAVLLAVSCLVSGSVAFAHLALAANGSSETQIGSDSFSRANGSLGSGWTDDSDAGLSIVSDQVVGNGGNSGDLRTGESYPSDQYSQLAVGSVPLTGGQWIGPAVRMQNNGQSAYVGFYFANGGSPILDLFLRNGGNWKQLGTYNSGVLSAGTQLQVTAVGSTISMLVNGVARITATDTTLTGGTPGILASGSADAGAWSGGSVGSGGTTYSVGGTVSGLSGTVVLQDNGSDTLSVTANGSFTFATPLATGAAYAVTVQTNPSGQSCTVSNGTGTVGSANVTNVTVSCAAAATYSVGGTVSGLSGTVVLQDNGSDTLSVTANGSFTFATKLAGGAAYAVTVQTNPSGQTCTVSNGTGTVGSANVTSVTVSCVASGSGGETVIGSDSFNRANGSLGSGWTDDSDAGLSIVSDQVVGNGGNSGDLRTGESYPSDQFSQLAVGSTPLTGGQWIGPAVRMQANGQSGYVGFYYANNGSGPVVMLFLRNNGNWTHLGSTYNSGTLPAGTQLQVTAVGSTISVLVNGVARITVTNTTLTGGTPGILASGSADAGAWSGGSVGSGSPTTTYSVGGTVSGLSGTVVLQDNGSDTLSVTANGSFTFATKLATGAAYAATVQTNPSGQSCTVSNGTGTVGSANVTNVTVSCAAAAAPTYSVGGTVSGLYGTVVLQDNGSDTLSVTANGSFTFATKLAGGAAYAVTVQTNPSGQTCTVSNGTGTVGSANVTSVTVSCVASGSGGETVIGSDSFNRANGSLGSGWTDDSDAGLSIVSDQVVGNGGNSGDLRTGESYPSDQFSQLAVGSTPLTGGQWIGPAVRMQANGQSGYVGFYYANNGSGPVVMLFLRNNGNWTHLGSTYNSGTLPAGTQLQVTAVGSTISVLVNGVARITVTNTTLTGGTPGILASGSADAGAWSGGSVGSGSPTTTYSVGGTVSGLSGTVVLQDNGSDTLSVTANGSFTFATKLATGAAYAATVQAYPSGQTCTVSNGSGVISSANVTNIAVNCATAGSGGGPGDTVIASDLFNRANGSLGAGWTDDSDAGLSIVSGQVVGNGGNSGDLRTGESYPSDQFSQLVVGSTQLTGGQWIGAAVRMQASGQSGYVGFYYWNNGSPDVQLFLRNNGAWTNLGSYNSGALAPGTQLTLVAVGNTISFQINGVQVIGASDATLTGGDPGILASGSADAGAWYGGSASFQVAYNSTDSTGVKYYSVVSANNGYGPQTLRVLTPTNPAAGVAHNFLIVLPVEAGLGTTYGDGLATLQSLDAQDQYNLTIVEPTFAMQSWYANNPNDPHMQYETFMTQELVPWIKQNLATTGHEQVWLLGFSKSGLGAQDLILKHPNLFTLAATWDFPADMASYNSLSSDAAANYGTDANYQANYRLTQAFVDSYKTPFLTSDRIWLGSYALYQQDVADYNALLTSEGILHDTETPTSMAHRWDSGWVPGALAALYQDSLKQ
jgi:hypothetical protein